MNSKMASWLLAANMESAKPQVMPPPSAFAFPYGQSEDPEFEGLESPAAGGMSGFGLGSDGMGTASGGNTVYTLGPTQQNRKSKNIEKKKGNLHTRRKQINKILKTMQDQQKRKTLLQERQTIVRELKRLTELESTVPQVPPHSPPVDSASACSDHSHKENKVKGSDTFNTQQVTDTSDAQSTAGSASPCKAKSKRFLRKRRREVYELLNNSLLTKKRKTELEQELADINDVLKKPRKTVFDEFDFHYAEQLFGNDEEEQSHDVDQYIPNPEEIVEPLHNNNIFELKRTSKQTAKWNKSPNVFPQLGEQEANRAHLGEAYKESFRDYFNGNPAYAHHFDKSLGEELPHGSHEEHFEPRINPVSHFINEALADDCRRHLERIGVVISDANGQISVMARQNQRERSPDLPFREGLPGVSYREGSPGYPNRERTPGLSYREESPTPSYREGSPDYPYRERSPGHSYRGRSPCSYKEGSPSPSYRERLPPSSYRERSPYQADREASPGPSYEEREMSPYPAYRERFPNHSYRNRSDRGSHSQDGSVEPIPPSRFRRFSGHVADAHEDFQDDYSPRMDDPSPIHNHGGPDRYMSEDQRKEEEQREEDLRIHLLRLREQKVERRLKVLEQETKETESRLRRLQERRLSEELDDFLREQSKYWRKEDMEMERTNFSPQRSSERTRHGRRNHQIYF